MIELPANRQLTGMNLESFQRSQSGIRSTGHETERDADGQTFHTSTGGGNEASEAASGATPAARIRLDSLDLSLGGLDQVYLRAVRELIRQSHQAIRLAAGERDNTVALRRARAVARRYLDPRRMTETASRSVDPVEQVKKDDDPSAHAEVLPEPEDVADRMIAIAVTRREKQGTPMPNDWWQSVRHGFSKLESDFREKGAFDHVGEQIDQVFAHLKLKLEQLT